jgi:hypothetical protein
MKYRTTSSIQGFYTERYVEDSVNILIRAFPIARHLPYRGEGYLLLTP